MSESEKLAALGLAVLVEIKEGMVDGCVDIDLYELADRAVDLNLMKRVAYDPEIHGRNVEADPGDIIYWWGE